MAAELLISEPENVPVAMEDLFVPCTRYWDRLIARAERRVIEYEVPTDIVRGREVELTAGAQEGVLTTGTWNWSEVWSFIKGKIVWFSLDVFIGGTGELPIEYLGFNRVLTVAMETDDDTSGDSVPNEFRIFASSGAQVHVACDRVLAYLSSAFGGGELTFSSWRSPTFPVSGPALSRFFSQSHGARRLRLRAFSLDTDQCLPLAAIEPIHGLDVELHYCEPTDGGASALMEGVRNSRGPSGFWGCYNIDDSLLLEALGGNTNVKKLKLSLYDANRPQLPMQALAENLGLVELEFSGHRLTDETLSAMCESLATHPTLEVLGVYHTLPPDDELEDAPRKSSRTESLVDMLRVNTEITSIRLTRHNFDRDLLDKEVFPRLKLNEYRPRFREISKTEGTLREPLLGRALGTVKDDASLLFLLLSGGTDIDWVALRRTRRSRKRVRYTK